MSHEAIALSLTSRATVSQPMMKRPSGRAFRLSMMIVPEVVAAIVTDPTGMINAQQTAENRQNAVESAR